MRREIPENQRFYRLHPITEIKKLQIRNYEGFLEVRYAESGDSHSHQILFNTDLNLTDEQIHSLRTMDDKTRPLEDKTRSLASNKLLGTFSLNEKINDITGTLKKKIGDFNVKLSNIYFIEKDSGERNLELKFITDEVTSEEIYGEIRPRYTFSVNMHLTKNLNASSEMKKILDNAIRAFDAQPATRGIIPEDIAKRGYYKLEKKEKKSFTQRLDYRESELRHRNSVGPSTSFFPRGEKKATDPVHIMPIKRPELIPAKKTEVEPVVHNPDFDLEDYTVKLVRQATAGFVISDEDKTRAFEVIYNTLLNKNVTQALTEQQEEAIKELLTASIFNLGWKNMSWLFQCVSHGIQFEENAQTPIVLTSEKIEEAMTTPSVKTEARMS